MLFHIFGILDWFLEEVPKNGISGTYMIKGIENTYRVRCINWRTFNNWRSRIRAIYTEKIRNSWISKLSFKYRTHHFELQIRERQLIQRTRYIHFQKHKRLIQFRNAFAYFLLYSFTKTTLKIHLKSKPCGPKPTIDHGAPSKLTYGTSLMGPFVVSTP